MSFNLSTGAAKALLKFDPSASASYIANTISFGDGDGDGGLDTINDSVSGLATRFSVDDYVLILNPDGAEDNLLVRPVSVAAGKIEVPAGVFSASEAAGNNICLVAISFGSLAGLMKNSVIDIYSSTRPTNADLAENGTKLIRMTKNGGAFTAGEPTNGLNLGEFSGTTLKRAIDPATGLTEVWSGEGITDGDARWGRWRDNSAVEGSSTEAIHMDGIVGTEFIMAAGSLIVAGVTSTVTDVNFTIATQSYS